MEKGRFFFCGRIQKNGCGVGKRGKDTGWEGKGDERFFLMS
jgi:hypothetical protein